VRIERFVGLATGLSLLLVAVGYVPTRHVGGPGAVPAMIAGCGIGLIAALLAAVPIALGAGAPPMSRVSWALGAMLVRLLGAMALGGLVTLAGWFERAPLLIWLAISYLALLAVETMFTVKLLGGPRRAER
jgi:hypothetical protein